MGVLLELRVADPMPPLDTPAVSHQLKHCFWGRPDAREKEMAGVKGFAGMHSRVFDSFNFLSPKRLFRAEASAWLPYFDLIKS